MFVKSNEGLEDGISEKSWEIPKTCHRGSNNQNETQQLKLLIRENRGVLTDKTNVPEVQKQESTLMISLFIIIQVQVSAEENIVKRLSRSKMENNFVAYVKIFLFILLQLFGLVSFHMLPISSFIVPNCLVKHQLRCCHKGFFFFLNAIKIQLITFEQLRTPFLTWIQFLQLVESLKKD